MLSHLLHLRGIDSVVLDVRTRDDVERTVKAGVLEQTTVDLMVAAGVGDRLLAEGTVHRGINLVFGGALHRIDLHELTRGRAITLYAQHEVLKDLIARRLADGGDLRFGVTDLAVGRLDSLGSLETDRPAIRFVDATGDQEIECDFVAGCDGAHSYTRGLIPAAERTMFFRQYPFAWFGILAETSRPVDEVLYAHSERGFALLSSRSPTLQRMYFQCDPDSDPDQWSDEQIWSELRSRVAGAGVVIDDGPIVKKDVLPFRSLVCEPMQHGRLFLAGDAAHTVPPTGAKGMNLAIADVYLLDRALGAYYATGDPAMLAAYSEVALRRVWRVQHISWWWTSMLHRFSDVTDFDLRRQLAELEMIVETRSARQTLADFYVGPPLDAAES
jgi:p-hydroxybenzoate 3-monooxygenase